MCNCFRYVSTLLPIIQVAIPLLKQLMTFIAQVTPVDVFLLFRTVSSHLLCSSAKHLEVFFPVTELTDLVGVWITSIYPVNLLLARANTFSATRVTLQVTEDADSVSALKGGVCEGQEERDAARGGGSCTAHTRLKVTHCGWAVGTAVSRLTPSAPQSCSAPATCCALTSLGCCARGLTCPSWAKQTSPCDNGGCHRRRATPAPAGTKAFPWALKPSSHSLFLLRFSLSGARLFCFSIVLHRWNENL